MSKAQHTPGPWVIERTAAALSTQTWDYIISYTDDSLRSHICRIYGNSLCTEHGDALSNARLIAAAPELLEALELTASNLRTLIAAQHHDKVLMEPWLVVVEAIIAKAKGE